MSESLETYQIGDCELAQQNVNRLNLQDVITVRNGDLFAPVKGMKFDIVVNDVSGIAELPGRVAGWYPPSVNTGREDGASVVIRLFERVADFLNPDGILYFATPSLSNVTRILDSAKEVMGDQIKELGKFRIPFSRELTDAIEPLKFFCEQGYVSFKAKRSRYVWTLSDFRCQRQG